MKKFLSINLAALIVAAAGVTAYWYFSPYLALRNIAAAVEAQDADAFNEIVDYPRLRESLKGQFSAQMAQRFGDTSRPSSGALFAMLGMAFVNQQIDGLVRPEMVMHM